MQKTKIGVNLTIKKELKKGEYKRYTNAMITNYGVLFSVEMYWS